MPRAKDVPRKNKPRQRKAGDGNASRREEEEEDDDGDTMTTANENEVLNESISGGPTENFRGWECGRIFNFPPTFGRAAS